MRQVPKTIRKAVRILTDPIPEFVSLVGRGANQTPFRVVKFDPTALIDEDKDMPKAHEAVIRQDGDKVIKRADIVRIDFASANFATEDAVTSFLTDRGYEDFSVIKSDTGFTVAGRNVIDFDKDSISPIELRPGAVVTVGKVTDPAAEAEPETPEAPKTDGEPTDPQEEGVHKATEGDAEDDEAKKVEEAKAAEVKKAEEDAAKVDPFKIMRETDPDIAKKFDDWIAQFSNAENIKDVMKTGADGLPPGMGEITGAMFTALRNALGRGNNSAVEGIAGEFAEMVVKLAKAFPFATITQSDDIERAAAAKAAAEAEGDTPGDPNAGIAEIVSKAMKAAVGDLSGLADNINTIKVVTDKTAEQTTEVITKMTAMDERVANLEKVRQTRKGEDPDGEDEEKHEETQKADAHNERMRRNSLGIG